MANKLNKFEYYLVLIFILIEASSALAYYFENARGIIFIILVIMAFILALKRLEYGVLMLFGELFLGGKGYLLFYGELGNAISIRMALFTIVMSAFLAKLATNQLEHAQYRIDLKKVYSGATLKYLYLFLSIIFVGVIQGILRKYNFGNVLLDANGYFFIFLAIPIIFIAYQNETLKINLQKLLLVASSWLSAKTLILFIIFAYNADKPWLRNLYLWVRNTTGEITPMGDNLFRIFLQSQIYIVFAFLMLLASSNVIKRGWIKILIGGLYLGAMLVSMSRSFWVGLDATIIFYLIYNAIKNKPLFKTNLKFVLASGLTAITIIAILYAPIIGKVGERAFGFMEPGASSRAAQFKPLLSEIIKSPAFGHGFGKLVTYKTSDPRILTSNPRGEYTTYAFELGYLDIILKIGLLGLVMYFLFIYKLWRGLEDTWLKLGLMALLLINIFSPYLNHPLGIGYLLLAIIFQSKNRP